MRWFSVIFNCVCDIPFASFESSGLSRAFQVTLKDNTTTILLRFLDHRSESTIKRVLEKLGHLEFTVASYESDAKLKESTVWRDMEDAKGSERLKEWKREVKAASPVEYFMVASGEVKAASPVECFMVASGEVKAASPVEDPVVGDKLQYEVERLTGENKRLEQKLAVMEEKLAAMEESESNKKRKKCDDEEEVELFTAQQFCNCKFAKAVSMIRSRKWIYKFMARYVAEELKLPPKAWDEKQFVMKPAVEDAFRKSVILIREYCFYTTSTPENRKIMRALEKEWEWEEDKKKRLNALEKEIVNWKVKNAPRTRIGRMMRAEYGNVPAGEEERISALWKPCEEIEARYREVENETYMPKK